MNNRLKVVVIGGSGLIGTKLVKNLRQRGHEVVAASPSSGVNTLTGEGLAEVLKSAYPDPTADDPQWVAVDLKPVKPLANPVQLAAIRYDKRLSQLPLIRQSQLSVMPLTKDEFDVIVAMGSGKARKR